jgi:hypothetical protein
LACTRSAKSCQKRLSLLSSKCKAGKVNQGLDGRSDTCIAQKLAHIIVSHASNLVKQKLDRQQYFSTDLGECHMFSNISH